MKKFLLYTMTAVPLLLAALEITPGKNVYFHQPGEKIKFHVKLDSGREHAQFKITINGNREIRGSMTRTADKNGEAEFTITPYKPGFVYVKVSDNGKSADCGVAVQPEKILPARTKPASFDSYWDKFISDMDIHPVSYEISEMPKALKGFKAFDVVINMPGNTEKIYCVMTMPVNATLGRHAAKVVFHGFGNDKANPMYHQNAVTLSVSPIPERNNGSNGSLLKQDPELRKYPFRGMDNLKENYFVGMIKRAYRALQFVKMLPEWDQRTLIVYGSSQGGAQAIAAAGLDPQVTFCAASMPGLCNHGGFEAGMESGWPKYHSRETDYEADPDKVLSTLDYIDNCFFASRIRNAEVLFVAGFLDQTCVPSSVYSAYNVIPSASKNIINDIHTPHRLTPQTAKKINSMIDDHITRMQKDFN